MPAREERAGRQGSRFLGPLSESDFRYLYAARALSLLGDAVVPVALAFAVLGVDSSASGLGMVLGARTVSLVLFLLLGGVIADRLPRKVVLIGSDVVRLVAQGVSAALVITNTAQVWHLAGLGFLFGVGWAFFLPTSTALVPETVSPGRLQQANALIASTFSIALVVGPALGGVLVVVVGAGWALGLDAVTFLLSALFVAKIRSGQRRPEVGSTMWGDFRQGWREFLDRTWLWVDGVYAAVAAFVFFPAFYALGPVIADRFLEGPQSWAAIVTCFGLGSVTAGLVLLRFRPERPLLVAVPPLMLLAAPLLLMAFTSDVLLIGAGAFLGGSGLTFFNTLFETTVQEHVPAEALSRVASIDWMMGQGLQPIGYALVGPFTAAAGFKIPLVAASVWLIVATLLVLTVPSVRHLSLSDR